MKTIMWKDGIVVLINQKKLPNKLEYIECENYKQLAHSISSMEIRGAPALGIAAAMGLALAAYHSKAKKVNDLYRELDKAAELIKATRPTANNLFWAVDRILATAHKTTCALDAVKKAVINEAITMAEEDININRAIGRYGATMLHDGDVIGTICNAGWLATTGIYGTALGVVKVAHEQGKNISVIALETRPVLQGSRLTAFELMCDNINVRVITDGMIGYCFYKGLINKFICGADRIIIHSGGHILNKIGTYTVAIVAKYHKIPFYVAAPISTFDFKNKLEDIIIEERDPIEITEIGGHLIAPKGVSVLNPAFDITPPELVDAIITERGVIRPPFRENIERVLSEQERYN